LVQALQGEVARLESDLQTSKSDRDSATLSQQQACEALQAERDHLAQDLASARAQSESATQTLDSQRNEHATAVSTLQDTIDTLRERLQLLANEQRAQLVKAQNQMVRGALDVPRLV
jgi:phage shock protein A